MTSIGRRCRDGNVYSRAVLIARTLSLSPYGLRKSSDRRVDKHATRWHTAQKTEQSPAGAATEDNSRRAKCSTSERKLRRASENKDKTFRFRPPLLPYTVKGALMQMQKVASRQTATYAKPQPN